MINKLIGSFLFLKAEIFIFSYSEIIQRLFKNGLNSSLIFLNTI